MSQAPLRILVSDDVWRDRQQDIASIMATRPYVRVTVDEILAGQNDVDVAFISRDITGKSTKHVITPQTQRYYDALLGSDTLRWVHVHSAGADRFAYIDLMDKGVQLTTSPGANATAVSQTALAGILAIARNLPSLMESQRAHRWAPLIHTGLPADMEGQKAVIVGWGPIGQLIGRVLHTLGLEIIVVRQTIQPVEIASKVVSFAQWTSLLPQTDWLVLACPLTEQTTNLVSKDALDSIKHGACIANVSRGAVIDEEAMIEKLKTGHLRGAYLDVFATEPLPEDSPIWDLPNVIATPHTAGFSNGMYRRMEQMFLDNLERYVRSEPLKHIANR